MNVQTAIKEIRAGTYETFCRISSHIREWYKPQATDSFKIISLDDDGTWCLPPETHSAIKNYFLSSLRIPAGNSVSELVKYARIEAAIVKLESALFSAYACAADSGVHDYLKPSAASCAEFAEQQDWGNADQIMVTQFPGWTDDPPNQFFASNQWERSGVPISSVGAVLAASLYDEALANPTLGPVLMIAAMAIMGEVYYYQGWEFHEEYLKEEARINGKKGGAARHGRTTSLKEWARKRAMEQRGSTSELARRLSAEIPQEFANLSADPVRLIYKALRSSPTNEPEEG